MEIEDDDDDDDDETGSSPKAEVVTLLRIAPLCEQIFMKYYTNAKVDVMIKVAALQALSGVFMAHPRQMLKLEISGVITEVSMNESNSDNFLLSSTCLY